MRSAGCSQPACGLAHGWALEENKSLETRQYLSQEWRFRFLGAQNVRPFCGRVRSIRCTGIRGATLLDR